MKQRQVLARQKTLLFRMTARGCPQVRQIGFKLGDARCQIGRRCWATRRRLDLVEDVAMGRVERIAATPSLARDRSRADPHDAPSMIGMPPFAAL